MSDKPDVQTEGGAYVDGNVTTGGDFVGRDKITTIIAGLARWQTALLLAIVVLVIGMIALVGWPYLQQLAQRTAPPPDPAGLQAISASQGLAITALAVSQPWLWLGVRKGEKFFLYKADSTKQAQLSLLAETAVGAQINQMAVDCQGKVWLLLEALGTQVYDPVTGQLSELLNRQTTAERLSKNTMHAIATRCLSDQTPEVWLGREGVYTLRTQGVNADSPVAKLLPAVIDQVYTATHTLTEISALLAVSNTLWVADRVSMQLLTLSPDNMIKPQTLALDDTPLSISRNQQSGDLWVGAEDHLFTIHQGQIKDEIELAPAQGDKSILRASTVATVGEYVWIGDFCAGDSGTPCCPLATYVVGAKAPFCFAPQLVGVNDLSLDEANTLWIATNHGLFLFSTNQ